MNSLNKYFYINEFLLSFMIIMFFFFLVKILFKLVRIDGNVNIKLNKTKIIFKFKLFYEFDACL